MSAWSVSQCLLPIYLKGSPDVFPGSVQYLPFQCLSVSFCQCLLWGTCWCLPGLNSRVLLLVSFWWAQSMSRRKCFPMSFANLSKGITWCLPGSTQCLPCLCLSDGFDQCLSELVLTCLFLPMSIMRTLLMSVWTEFACLLAKVFLVNSIGVCLKCFLTSSAKSICVFCQCLLWGTCWCLSELNSCVFLPMSF